MTIVFYFIAQLIFYISINERDWRFFRIDTKMNTDDSGDRGECDEHYIDSEHNIVIIVCFSSKFEIWREDCKRESRKSNSNRYIDIEFYYRSKLVVFAWVFFKIKKKIEEIRAIKVNEDDRSECERESEIKKIQMRKEEFKISQGFLMKIGFSFNFWEECISNNAAEEGRDTRCDTLYKTGLVFCVHKRVWENILYPYYRYKKVLSTPLKQENTKKCDLEKCN